MVEGLACESDPTQTYTLYLPSTYDPASRWPVLLVLDPRGRSVVAAELFRGTAEEYGWIILSSNDTRSDESMEPNRLALNALWAEIHSRYAIDPRRIYAAGFSGTVFVAYLVAQQTGGLAGVIGAGGRYIEDALEKNQVAMFGAVGDTDFNYPEMRQMDEFLARQGNPHRLEVFPGGHEWMPEPLARQAVEWMELEAMRSGRRPRDETLIARLYAEDMAAADRLERSGDPLGALERCGAIDRTFQELHDTSEARDLAERLAARRELKQARKERERWDAYEAKYLTESFPAVYAFRAAEVAPAAAVLARDLRLDDLQHHAVADGWEATTARRLLNNLYTTIAFYLTRDLFSSGMYGHAAAALEVATRIREDSPVVWYNLACARARAGRESAAVEALERAVDLGYSDVDHIEADQDLGPIRDLERYRALVARLRQAPGTG